MQLVTQHFQFSQWILKQFHHVTITVSGYQIKRFTLPKHNVIRGSKVWQYTGNDTVSS